jgi:hypothetical protein
LGAPTLADTLAAKVSVTCPAADRRNWW